LLSHAIAGRYRFALLQHPQPLQRQGGGQAHTGAQPHAAVAPGLQAQASWLQEAQEQSGFCFDICFSLSERWAHP
jgi:hypothetical protein